jgi:hypothetical protein
MFKCSFCSKSQDDIKLLIQGPKQQEFLVEVSIDGENKISKTIQVDTNIFICEECILVCIYICVDYNVKDFDVKKFKTEIRKILKNKIVQKNETTCVNNPVPAAQP